MPSPVHQIGSEIEEPEQIDILKEAHSWFGPSKNSTIYPLIQEYLNGTSNLTELILKLSEHVVSDLSEKKDVPFFELYYSILHSAKRIPWGEAGGHTKLITLIKRLKDPSADDADHFSGIPDWNMATRKVMNDGPGVGAGYSVTEAHAWANLNYFLARLDKERIWGDFIPLYGLWGLREALERVHKDDGPNDAHKPGTKVEKYNSLVPAAAMWVTVLGKDLFGLEKDMTPTNPNQGNPARGGELWKGKAEFSKERWTLWKKRFEEVSQMGELSEETRNIAAEAVDVMEEAEKS